MRQADAGWRAAMVTGAVAGVAGVVGIASLALMAGAGRLPERGGPAAVSGPLDLDGDGVIGVEDLQRLVAGLEGADPSLDLNGDGRVDRGDVRVMIENLGASAADEDVYLMLANEGVVPPPLAVIEANSHHPTISGSYPPPGHSTANSDQWPNHTTNWSTTWPSGHTVGVTSTWPPNHGGPESSFWYPNSPEHTLLTSAGFPPNHRSAVSTGWGNHDNAVSKTWPPGHERSSSIKPRDTWPHNTHSSDNWDKEPKHTKSASLGKWPPNHWREFSDYWDHDKAVSKTWPANHHRNITASWEPNGHQRDLSLTWPPSWHAKSWSDKVAGSSSGGGGQGEQ